MAFGNEIRAGSSGQSTGFYNGVINQSLRLSAGSNYKLDRQMVTPTSVTGTICTASWWMKKTAQGTVQSFIQCRDNQSSGEYAAYWTYGVPTSGDITGTDHHSFRSGGAESIIVGSLNSHKPYNDASAWYHVVIRYDSTQSTAADRIRIYKNGELQNATFQGTTYPSQNATETYWNNAGEHLILFGNGEDSGDSFDGFIAEFNWVDGQSLPPETFGESKNGIWIPKKITLSTSDYGLNGSRYTFEDSSDIGKDTSGVGNDLDRVSNLSSHDVVTDSPENNFCNLNTNFADRTANTVSEGALKVVTSTAGRSFNAGSFLLRRGTGKWWWEYRAHDAACGMGVARVNGKTGVGAYESVTSTGTGGRTTDYYYGANNWGTYQHTIVHNGSAVVTLSGSASYPQIYGVLVDTDTSSPNLEYYVNGSAVGNIDLDLQYDFIPIIGDGSGGVSRTLDVNFGQNPTFNGEETAGSNTDSEGFGLFSQAVPSGAKCLCTSNLPDVTIGPDSDSQAEDFMNTILYTSDNIGAGGTQNVTGVGFQPDWVWIKNLSSNSTSHTIYDSNRGTGRHISSENTSQEVGPNSIYGYLSAFGSDGFTLTGGTTNANYINQGTDIYAAWNWKANSGTTTTNDASATSIGTIDSTHQANTTAGFSIVSYTGTGSEGTVAHGLSEAPNLVIIKNRSSSPNGQWVIGNTDDSFTGQIYFDSNAFGSNTGSFNNTIPTSTLVNINTDNTVNESGDSFIMYCFHNVEGYSRIGTYYGSGVDDGPMVYLGFRPQWILLTETTTNGRNWIILDDTRFGVGTTNQRINPVISNINPNNSDKEFDSVSYPMIDFLSNGFKVVNGADGSTISQDVNKSTGVFLYLAFANSPFKFANGF